MMEYLLLFLEWLKAVLAKEILFAFLSIPLAALLSWLAHAGFSTQLKPLGVYGVERYWIYLFMTFLILIYGTRLVEIVLKSVLLKKDKKE